MTDTDTGGPFDERFRFPADLVEAHRGARGRVAVIGGGVCGLACAYELTRRGLEVTVYERAARPGGRIRTHRFWDGTHGELGAVRLPSRHHIALDYVRRFRLTTRTFVDANPDAYLHLRGQRVRARDAHTLAGRYGLTGPQARDPRRSLEELLHHLWSALRPEQHKAILAGEADDPDVEALMSTSLRQYAGTRLTPQAWDLAGQASGLAHYEHASLLEVLVDRFGLLHTEQLELADGMDSLISAFVRALPPRTLRLSAPIERIAVDGDGVRVLGRGFGGRLDERHDWAVCALPAPALDRVRFEPGLPPGRPQAVPAVHHASSSKTLLHVNRRVWELSDRIHGGGSFTDLPVQQCWYPSDNARRAGENWEAADPARSHEPAVLTGAHLWGDDARRFSTLPEEDRTGLVLESLEQLHPGIADTVDDIVHWDWDRDRDGHPGIGESTVARLAPGRHDRHPTGPGAPHPAERPRVFFAGERPSVAHAWIQGALESALAAVRGVLEQAGDRTFRR